MPVLVTGDLHWSANPRDQYRHDFVKQLCATAQKFSVDSIVLLGDLTETKDNHPSVLANAVVEHIHNLSLIAPVYIDKGNHDFLGDASNPFFRFSDKLNNVTWVNSPSRADDLFKRVQVRSLFLPFTDNYQKDWEGVDFKKYRFIFAHQTFKGAVVENGDVRDGIPLTVFPENACVISGDVHTPQKLGCVTYVGAPYLIDFGNDYTPRLLIIEDDGKLRSVPCTGAQKRLIEVDGPEDFKRQNIAFNSDDIYKIRLRVKEQEKWPEMKAAVYEWAKRNNIKIDQVLPLVEQRQHSIKREITAPKSERELLETYAKARGLSDRVLKTGLKLLEGV